MGAVDMYVPITQSNLLTAPNPLFHHSLGDQLIDRGFNETGPDPFVIAIPFAIVGDPWTIVDNVPIKFSECSREPLQDRVILSIGVIEFGQHAVDVIERGRVAPGLDHSPRWSWPHN